LNFSNGIYFTTEVDGIFYSSNNGLDWSTFNTGLTDLAVNFIADYQSTLICGIQTE
jgi:hypothetical protein